MSGPWPFGAPPPNFSPDLFKKLAEAHESLLDTVMGLAKSQKECDEKLFSLITAQQELISVLADRVKIILDQEHSHLLKLFSEHIDLHLAQASVSAIETRH